MVPIILGNWIFGRYQGRGFWMFAMSFHVKIERVSYKRFIDKNYSMSANKDLCVHQTDPARHTRTGFHQREIMPLYKTLSILIVKTTLSFVQNPRPIFLYCCIIKSWIGIKLYWEYFFGPSSFYRRRSSALFPDFFLTVYELRTEKEILELSPKNYTMVWN